MPYSVAHHSESEDKKIARNIGRDREVAKELKKRGWKVLRIREHDLKRNPKKTADRPTRNLDFRKLIDFGVIKKAGKGRATYYKLK